jgi:cytochrome d ubiquinol oxidase subunit II
MDVETFWFCLIAFFWAGYLMLEGFDFGVGMLLPFLPRDESERGTMLETIGPFWDGNEVWLVVVAGATFAAFPTWYATMFSAFYLALLLVLVCLIIRVVSFEWRSKADSPGWRGTWLYANAAGSVGVPFLWGVALANLVQGIPLGSDGSYAGGLADLFSLYTVLAGVAMVALFAFHGAVFLTLRTSSGLCERAALAARRLALPAILAGVAFLVATVAVAVDANDRDVLWPSIPAAAAIVALVTAGLLVRAGRSGRAFTLTALGIVAAVATIFTGLYPRVIVSAPDFANSLTISNAAASSYALRVLTVVGLVLTPVVLLYQGWTYHVFRARVGGDAVAPTPPA